MFHVSKALRLGLSHLISLHRVTCVVSRLPTDSSSIVSVDAAPNFSTHQSFHCLFQVALLLDLLSMESLEFILAHLCFLGILKRILHVFSFLPDYFVCVLFIADILPLLLFLFICLSFEITFSFSHLGEDFIGIHFNGLPLLFDCQHDFVMPLSC